MARPCVPTRRAAGVLFGSAAVAFSLCLEEPGEPKRGRIAIDGSHSEWEWTNVPLDRERFGSKTTYNYWSLLVLLRQHFPVVESVVEGPLGPGLLEDYDVWILKTPTRAYTREEVAALRAYVERGGSLWLIGEHTDIFGINTHLNAVAENFGISFRADAACNYATSGARQYWEPGRFPHPVVGPVPDLLFATSCTLRADWLRTRPVMVGEGLFADAPHYGSVTFFGDLRRQPTEPYGRFHQCVAARAGRGRVVAFTDSTIFSSFSAHLKGKPELALGTIAWLNQRNRPPILRGIAFAFGILGLAVPFLPRRHRARRGVWIWAGPLFWGAVFGYGGSRVATGLLALRVPAPRWTSPRAAFLVGDPLALPLRFSHPHDEDSPRSLETFFVWFQRADVLPFVVESFREATHYDLVVLLEPSPVSPEKGTLLRRYLKEGGEVWCLTSSRSTAESFLALCAPGSAVVPFDPPQAPSGRTRLFDGLHDRWLSSPRPAFGLSGLDPILTTEDGRAVFGSRAVGRGCFYLCSAPALFSNAEMGSPTQIPTEERYALYKVQWQLIDECLGRAPPTVR